MSPARTPSTVSTKTLLKRHLLGSVFRLEPGSDAHGGHDSPLVERDTRTARWWLRALARRLAAREACALQALHRVPGVPRLTAWDGRHLRRSWLDGAPMHHARPRDRAYYREALHLLRRVHAAGVVHNDLAREPNWLVRPDGLPALVDFQLALRPRYRGHRFRALAYDDLRHLLEHKRRYCAEALTARQRAMLARRSSWPTELWRRTGQPGYLWITRGVLRWSDREGVDRDA
jgi:RIO-like serine/threonine protein kinase